MSKGFRKEPTHYKLSFEDEKLRGLEVIVKALPLRDFLEIQRLTVESGDDAAKQFEQNKSVYMKFADAIVSWNLEDDNGPVPATFEGVIDQESSFVAILIKGWLEAMTSVPKESKPDLNDGGTSQEALMPMEVL
jgi:hypothetical protein